MLPKEYRLKNNLAFTTTYRLNNVVANRHFILYLGKQISDETQNLKIGFVVSKKVHKRAVIRNKIKRRLREIFRIKLKDKSSEGIKSYRSLIVIAKSTTIDIDYRDMEKSIEDLLKRISNVK